MAFQIKNVDSHLWEKLKEFYVEPSVIEVEIQWANMLLKNIFLVYIS